MDVKRFWDDPLYRFLIRGFLLYIGWYLIYDLWLHPMGQLDLWVIKSLERSSYWVLETVGFTTLAESNIENIRTIGIDGTHGLWIGDPCNGLTLFALFTGFVLAYPGPAKKKLWFIPIGIVAIHIVNIIRIVGLSLVIYFFPEPEVLDFNHTYTFTILVYGFVFFLWYVWAAKLSGIQSMKTPSKEDEQA